MYDRCLIDFGLIFKDCRAHFAPKFHAKEPWDELCDYFELILGSCRGIGEVVGSLMLENRSQNEGNQAAHLHFDTKRGSANLLKAPQSLPKGLLNRIKVVKRNNHQRIDKLYAFEGGFLVSLDAKMMIFADTFRRSNMQKPFVFR